MYNLDSACTMLRLCCQLVGVRCFDMWDVIRPITFSRDDEDEFFDATVEDEPLCPITTSRDVVSILQKGCIWHAPYTFRV